MNSPGPKPTANVIYYVDEAGDGVLFGPKGRNRLDDSDAPKFFILGMVCCTADEVVVRSLDDLRAGLQKKPLLADYCVWALQRCYEKHEPRFLNAIWPKVSLIHDVDDPHAGRGYGKYLTRKSLPPDPEQIKSRWI